MVLENNKLDNLTCLSAQIEVLHRLSVEATTEDRSVLDVILMEKSEHLCSLVSGVNQDAQSINPYNYTLNQLHPTTETIGARIQLARENLGLTEADVARELGIYSDHISDWECGITELPAGMVIPLANALKCDPLWLLGDFDGIEPPALTEAPLAPVKIMQGVDMSGVGKRIRESRVSRRMTHEELENAAHLPEGVTSAWESGKTYPPDEAFDKLAKALNTSVTWLLTGRQIEAGYKAPISDTSVEMREQLHYSVF